MVSNTTPSGTTHLVYDTAGHVIAEANGLSGTTTREYVWLPNEKTADPGPMSAPASAGLSTGKLGSAEHDSAPTSAAQLISLNQPKQGIGIKAMPLAVVSGVDTGSPVTYFVHSDHLDRPIKMTDASANSVWDAIYKPFGEAFAITGTASLDARLPGQWFQLETGLAYNWHRHYDATTGRYLTPDPFGFVDGPSVYAYARNAPTTTVDPFGLETPRVAEPWSMWISPGGRTCRFFDGNGNADFDIDIPGHEHPPGEYHLWDNGNRGPAIPF
ncbi:RHS repeat-associated core domain-containing protein [Rhizobiales bacterium GAS191]|nr:RHS repeat-associated core domain-containing protein [Rhizobiales bacterium GAS191]